MTTEYFLLEEARRDANKSLEAIEQTIAYLRQQAFEDQARLFRIGEQLAKMEREEDE